MRPCRKCDGGGEIAFNDSAPRDPQKDRYARCPWCGGSGAESSVEEEQAWKERETR